jgi:hypothetical protein
VVREETIKRLEGEVEFLIVEYSKLNEALAQRLLAEAKPRRSIWDA